MDFLSIAVAIVNDWPEHQVHSTHSFVVEWLENDDQPYGIGWGLLYVNDEYIY